MDVAAKNEDVTRPSAPELPCGIWWRGRRPGQGHPHTGALARAWRWHSSPPVSPRTSGPSLHLATKPSSVLPASGR